MIPESIAPPSEQATYLPDVTIKPPKAVWRSSDDGTEARLSAQEVTLSLTDLDEATLRVFARMSVLGQKVRVWIEPLQTSMPIDGA